MCASHCRPHAAASPYSSTRHLATSQQCRRVNHVTHSQQRPTLQQHACPTSVASECRTTFIVAGRHIATHNLLAQVPNTTPKCRSNHQPVSMTVLLLSRGQRCPQSTMTTRNSTADGTKCTAFMRKQCCLNCRSSASTQYQLHSCTGDAVFTAGAVPSSLRGST